MSENVDVNRPVTAAAARIKESSPPCLPEAHPDEPKPAALPKQAIQQTAEEELSGLPKAYTVEAQEAAQFLEVGRTRLSQLTTNGVLSFEKRKIGFRYRNFYDQTELENYVSLRRMGHQAQIRNRVVSGASAQWWNENAQHEDLAQTAVQDTQLQRKLGQLQIPEGFAAQSPACGMHPANQDNENPFFSERPAPISQTFQARNKPASRKLKKALELLQDEDRNNKTESSLKFIENQILELKDNLAAIERLCLTTQLQLRQTLAALKHQSPIQPSTASQPTALNDEGFIAKIKHHKTSLRLKPRRPKKETTRQAASKPRIKKQ